MVAVAEGYRITSASTGRVRVQLPNWGGQARASVEDIVRQIPGVSRVVANALTGTLLIHYDESVTDAGNLLNSVESLDIEQSEPLPAEERSQAAPPRVRVEQVEEQRQRVRVPVAGLSRNPSAAYRIVRRLDELSGIHRVHASPLTGRVLVEFAENQISLSQVHDELERFQDHTASHEAQFSPPGDLSPLLQRAIRLGGATAGLGVLSIRRLLGLVGPPTASAVPAISAELISVLRAFPATRNGIRSLLGKDTADAILSLGSIAALMLSGKTLGLAVAGVEGLRLLTELYSRRVAWQRYEQRLQVVPSALPGSIVRMEDGDFLPFDGTVLTGAGTVLSPDGKPVAVSEGDPVPSGPIVYGGPLEIQLNEQIPWQIAERPARPAPGILERYLKGISPFSVAYAVLTGLATRSWYGAFGALLMVNPRVAVLGRESADVSAFAQVLRSGATVVGMRPDHPIRLPDVLVLDSPRLLTERLELDESLSLRDDLESRDVSQIAAAIASEAGSPWGDAFAPVRDVKATNGSYNGVVASAEIDGVRYYLRPYRRRESHAEGDRMRDLGRLVLVLSDEWSDDYAALISLRPALATGVQELVGTCQEHAVSLEVTTLGDSSTAAGLADRAGVSLIRAQSALHIIQEHQSEGKIVAYVSDSARSGPMFDAADLSIGLTSGTSDFPARTDLIAPDLVTVSAVIRAGLQRDRSVRDSVFLSGIANVFGIGWGLTRARSLGHTTAGVHIASLAAIGAGWARLSGGELSRSSLTRLTDPRPERWGRQGVRSVISAFDSSVHGLAADEAEQRLVQRATESRGPSLIGAIFEQARSPLILTLAASGALSIFYGTPIDSILIGATIALNVGVAAWQEHSTDEAAERLEELSTSNATVIRDGRPMEVPADEVVPGDVLMLVAGDRVSADARIIRAENLEVDESALTGESLPVQKTASGASEENRIVLEGSDVTRGSGRAVVVAVGRKTRMGATAAALDVDEDEHSPLGRRLNQMLRGILPLAAIGGAIVVAAGMIRGRRLTTQIALGTTVAIGALPEGLPLLAKMGEAAVARRLAGRHALVRRLSSVEALGRVDVACTDKTGTLTEGRLVVDAIATLSQERKPAPTLGDPFREILLTAALASPHPDAPDAQAHQTDIAVMEAARRTGLRSSLDANRLYELSFDPERSSHVTVVEDRLCVKGAFEALIDRCDRVRFNERDILLDTAERERLLARAEELADRGQRVLMVAEGPPDTSPDDPEGLTALGFVGIRDPLRPAVPEAIRRCHEAGVRVVMITGDHPTTARAIGREAGILGHGNGQLLTGTEIAELSDEELDERLQRATIIARATPLDKLRIVEGFQRLGHCVAMTGDGVNDAPALRLADVGVAMGDHGTDVARHAADLVLTNDDFSTLVESFVEGRVFWSNIRRALGLLLGGNVGEIGLMAVPNLLGTVSPLTPRQVLAVNMITDALPALAVTLQEPEHRNLATLAHEGAAALGVPLRNDIAFRAIATQVPSLLAYFISLRYLGPVQGRSVAFASVIATQLAQTFDAVWTNQEMSKPMVAAMAGSALFLATSITVPFLQVFLGLSPLSLTGWLLAGAAAIAAVPLSRLLAWIGEEIRSEEVESEAALAA